MRKLLRKNKFLVSIIISLVIGSIASFLFYQGYLYSWQLKLSDNLYAGSNASSDIIIAGIDAKSLGDLGRWPIDRKYYIDAIKNLRAAGARVIGLDVLFSEKSDPETDELLRQEIEEGNHEIIQPILITFPKAQAVSNNFLEAESLTYPIINEVPRASEAEKAMAYAAQGHVNILPDSDGIVRRVPLRVALPGQTAFSKAESYIDSFDLKILDKFYDLDPKKEGQTGYTDLKEVEDDLSQVSIGGKRNIVDKFGRLMINYAGGPGSFSYLPFSYIAKNNFSKDSIRDKIVLIGVTDPAIPDSQPTPMSSGHAMYGVEIHANVLQTIITSSFLKNQEPENTMYLIMILSLLLGIILPLFKPLKSFFISIVGILLYIIYAATIVEINGSILNLVWPPLTIFFILILVTIYRIVFEERKSQEVSNAFSKYVSESVMKEILAHPEKLKLGGNKKEMTVLFADIRSFTTLSEKMKPEELVKFLNSYLDEMTRIILKHGGVLDKYIGDAIMAFWNAPLDQKNHADLACRAALEMTKALEEFNKKSGTPIKIGIGINTGEMIAGNMGSSLRFDYTVIGDSVNLASRLEGTNKEYGTTIIISETTREKIKDNFACRELDLIRVKGKVTPVRIYELLAEDINFERDHPYLAEFHQALSLYRAGDFHEAETKFNHVLEEMKPDDDPSMLLRERCDQYMKNSPPEGWDGVYDRRSK